MNRVEHRHRWVERRSWWRGRRNGLKRVDPKRVGNWPEIYERADGARIVTALYFKPCMDARTHLIALVVALGAIWCAYAIAPPVWGEREWAILVGAAVIGYWTGRVLGYWVTSSRMVMTFLPDGSVSGPGFSIAAHDHRSFATLDARSDPRAEEEQRAEDVIRARKGSNAALQPRHYRNASRVEVSYGSGNGDRPIVAHIGCDAFLIMSKKLRAALEEAGRVTGAQTAARRGMVVPAGG